MSAGGSVRATLEYIIGTVGGAIYGAVLGILVPHNTPLAEAFVMALAIAPLALCGGVQSEFPGCAVLRVRWSSSLPVNSVKARSRQPSRGLVKWHWAGSSRWLFRCWSFPSGRIICA